MNSLLLILLKDFPEDIALGGWTIGEVANFGITAVLILLAIALFVTVIGPLIYSALNIKDSWKGITAMAVFAIIAFVCYNMADGTLTKHALKMGMTENYQMKIVNSTLNMFWLFFAVTLALFVFSLLKDIILGFIK